MTLASMSNRPSELNAVRRAFIAFKLVTKVLHCTRFYDTHQLTSFADLDSRP